MTSTPFIPHDHGILQSRASLPFPPSRPLTKAAVAPYEPLFVPFDTHFSPLHRTCHQAPIFVLYT